jgi:hypothetical protein
MSINRVLQTLPDVLDYTGEFGAELVLFVPFCQWLSSHDALGDRAIRTYAGMRCFYDQMKCQAIIEKAEDRTYIPPSKRPQWLPIRDEHSLDIAMSKRFFIYPDLRSRFHKCPLPSDIAHPAKPLLIIHNKYTVEWNIEPINYIPLAALESLFINLALHYTIIYIRHGTDPGSGYSKDHNTSLVWQDNELLDRHPAVLNFDDLYMTNLRTKGLGLDLNTFKNAIYSRCYRFIASQGGGAHHIALFSGSLLAIWHRRGRESEGAYWSGYYSFMATPEPTRLICTDHEDLESLIPIFDNCRLAQRKIYLDRAVQELAQRLSPERHALRARSDRKDVSAT